MALNTVTSAAHRTLPLPKLKLSPCAPTPAPRSPAGGRHCSVSTAPTIPGLARVNRSICPPVTRYFPRQSVLELMPVGGCPEALPFSRTPPSQARPGGLTARARAGRCLRAPEPLPASETPRKGPIPPGVPVKAEIVYIYTIYIIKWAFSMRMLKSGKIRLPAFTYVDMSV